MAFTLAQLRLVLAIHEHGSLGKASMALSATQPALSRSLKDLERQLGVALFERHPSGLKATLFGRAVLPYAASALDEAARGFEELRVLAGESQQVVRIGTVSSAAVSVLPALIEQLMADAPGICVKVTEGIDEILLQSLQAHDVDLIICGPVPQSEEITSVLDLHFGDICTLLVGADHPLRERTKVSIAELLDQRWVAFPRDAMPRKFFDQLFHAQGLPAPKVLVETKSFNIIRTLLAQQGFITWGPAPLYVSADPGCAIATLDLPEFRLRRPFFVYRLRRASMSHAVRRTVSNLQRMAAAQVSGRHT